MRREKRGAPPLMVRAALDKDLADFGFVDFTFGSFVIGAPMVKVARLVVAVVSMLCMFRGLRLNLRMHCKFGGANYSLMPEVQEEGV